MKRVWSRVGSPVKKKTPRAAWGDLRSLGEGKGGSRRGKRTCGSGWGAETGEHRHEKAVGGKPRLLGKKTTMGTFVGPPKKRVLPGVEGCAGGGSCGSNANSS